ncbi:transporter [Actinokineospora sp. G85]|uniref:PH-like domain-containing protein n=1 Tax=Actinokineospora sp. G85 TaxID=3406626 RepID=UPI003C77D924
MTRLVLTLLTLAVILLIVLLMWWGYRGRARRQAARLPAFPPVPEGLLAQARAGELETLLPPSTGVYASTVTEASWQDRVAVGDVGFRANATAHLLAEGVLFDREGATAVWIPAAAVRTARTEAGIAGKVMGRDGLLVVRWDVDGHGFDTGFRADDKDDYDRWVPAVRALNPEVKTGE